MIDGIVYGEDPRQGYVDDNKFFHPELKFEFPIPANWKHMNSPQQFQMAPESGKAVIIFKFAEGQNLDDAANKFLSEEGIQVEVNKKTKLNELNVIQTKAIQPVVDDYGQPTKDTLVFQSNFIEYNNAIYQFMGVTTLKDISIYQSDFDNSLNNFKELKEPNRINVKPDRIEIKEVTQTATLKDVMGYYKMPTERYEELSLINGMELTETVQKGTLIKIIVNK